MEIFPGRRGRAHLSSWEQECCGSALRTDETALVTLQSAPTMDEDLSGAPVDWLLVLHEDDGPGMPPAHRALVRVERVQEVRLLWQQVSADGVAWAVVPGSARLDDSGAMPGREELAGQEGGVDGWIVDLVILEDLGPQRW